jgi:type I restriction enzyme S subunit
MRELPEGWTSCELKDVIGDFQAGFASGKKDVENGLKHLRMNNIGVDSKLNLELLRTVPPSLASQSHYLEEGDVLICTTNSAKLVGKCALFELEGEFAFSNYLTRLKANPAIESKYLLHHLWLLWKEGDFEHRCKHWVNQSTLPKEELLATRIGLPPFNEQRRIVVKLEKLLNRVDAAQARLATIPRILKRFRQSVLAAACAGRLTADWREANSNTKLSSSNHEVTSNLFEFTSLPHTWKWSTVENVCEKIVDCPHSTPVWTDTGFICVRTTNFKPNYLDLSEVRFVSKETYKHRIERLTPIAGDVLYSREGGILGIACIVPTKVKLCLGQRMMLLRAGSCYVPQLLMYWLNSPAILARVKELTGGSASPHLNVRDIKNFPIPFLSLTEQQEIVRRIEALFKTVDVLEARYRTAKAHVDKLTQSILARTFRGELVTTEAELARQEGRDYEPASVLLERIRQERTQQATSTKPKPKQHRAAKKAASSTKLFT